MNMNMNTTIINRQLVSCANEIDQYLIGAHHTKPICQTMPHPVNLTVAMHDQTSPAVHMETADTGL